MRALIARWRATPFGTLTAHFFRRFFEPEGVSGDSPLRAGIGPILGLIAMPGAILSLFLFQKYMPLLRALRRQAAFDQDAASLPDKYLFLAASVAVTAIVTALKWESLFPDRRDFLNLAPLPLSLRSIFFAKVLALSGFALVFIGSLNGVSSILFPLVVLEENGAAFEPVVRFIGGHIVAIGGASLATFCSLLALIGLSITILPYGLFRKISRYLQFVLITAALLCFFLVSALGPSLEMLRQGRFAPAAYLPPVWFLAWYVEIQGRAGPLFAGLAEQARHLLAASVVAAVFAYTFSYRAYFLKAAETRDIIPSLRSLADQFFPLLDQTFLRTGCERGTARFVLKTLFRSDRHTAVLAVSLGAACAMITVSLTQNSHLNWRIASPDLLGIPLTIVYFSVTALRMTFGTPAELQANWLFRTAVVDDTDPRRLACKLTGLFLAPMLVVTFLVSTALWGLAAGFLHTLFVATIGTLMCLFLFREFRSLPFTAASPPPGNLVMAAAGYLVAMVFIVYGLAGMEGFMLQHPGLFIIFYTLAGVAIGSLVRASQERERVIYETPPGSFELLRLSE